MNPSDPNTNDTARSRAKSTTQDTAPAAKRPTMLRRLLSHHELATLLLLLHAPIDAMAKPEMPQLHEAGLVETVTGENGGQRTRLTPEGNAILRGLGVR